MNHASSRAVSVMTSAGPCGPIMTEIITSGYITGYLVKGTANKSKVDQAVKDKISTVVSEGNRPTDQIQEKLKIREAVKIHAKLKPHAGDPEVEQYLAQFKMVVKLNEWPKDKWGTILATFLDDKARRLLPRDPSAEPTNFLELSKQLISRFSHEGQPSYFAALLQSVSR